MSFASFLLQVVTLVNTINAFAVLQDSKIEGIENLAAKFQSIFSSIKKKGYDVLDHRKTDFDNDYEDFKRHLSELEVN